MKNLMITLLLSLAFTAANAQKTTHGDCRTHLEASYSHGYYFVSITNYTQECSSYTILYPGGHYVSQTPLVNAGKKYSDSHLAPYFHGPVIVMPNNQAPANCPFGSVQVNL